MKPEGKLAALAKEYHTYSCKERIARYTQIGTISLFILGAGVSAASSYYDRYSLAVGSLASVTAIGIAGSGVGRKRRDYASRADDALNSLNIFEFKHFERDPLSLPVKTRQDISEKRDSVARYRF